MKKLIAVTIVLTVLILGGIIAATIHNNNTKPKWAKSASAPASRGSHGTGGTARVAVSTPPELGDVGEGGEAIRSLVYPHLFDAQPNGTWAPSIVQPGSDGANKDGLTAWFKLRPNLQWSDGSPITVADLKRTQDTRFITAIDGPASNGLITLHFKSPLPGWRNLWSGEAAVTPPSTTVFGGPFKITTVVSGADTILTANTSWFAAPFLDNLELDYVPDPTMQRELLNAGTVDVVQPVGDTVRTAHYSALKNVQLNVSTRGGRWIGIQYNSVTSDTQNAAVLSAFPRLAFVNSLLPGEATVFNGFAPDDITWLGYGSKPAQDLSGVNEVFLAPVEDPLSSLTTASMARAVIAQKGQMTPRLLNTSSVASLMSAGTYDLALVSGTNTPDTCWTCMFGRVDQTLATQADAGDHKAALALEVEVRNDGVFEPLWQDHTVVAYRGANVGGATANGYTDSVVWNAENWWKP